MFFGYTWFTHEQKTETVLGKSYFQCVRRYLPRLEYHESLRSLNLAWMWVTQNLNTDKLNCNFFIFSNVKSNVLDCCRSVFGKVKMSDLFFRPSFIVWKDNTVGCFLSLMAIIQTLSSSSYILSRRVSQFYYSTIQLSYSEKNIMHEYTIVLRNVISYTLSLPLIELSSLFNEAVNRVHLVKKTGFSFTESLSLLRWGSEQSSPGEINRV